MNDRMKQPWFIRTIVYSIAGIIGGVLFLLGLATAEQVNTTTEQVAPLILMIISGMAAIKANPQSDLPKDAVTPPAPVDPMASIRDKASA